MYGPDERGDESLMGSGPFEEFVSPDNDDYSYDAADQAEHSKPDDWPLNPNQLSGICDVIDNDEYAENCSTRSTEDSRCDRHDKRQQIQFLHADSQLERMLTFRASCLGQVAQVVAT